ncbi:Fic family protein [Corynebacterium propinquum]|uniref:Fic family protein n=2 Tax=Corynebacterium propinquum TaxID=43769 RepID=UPI000665CE15
MTDCRDQSAEEALAEKLVEVACALNKRCGMRASHSRDGLQEYSGFRSASKAFGPQFMPPPLQVFFGQAAYDSPFDRAAALIVNIAQGHHFGDGNKRTALHLGLLYLSMFGINAGRKLRQWSTPTATP